MAKTIHKKTNKTSDYSNDTLVRSINFLADITRKEIKKSLNYFNTKQGTTRNNYNNYTP